MARILSKAMNCLKVDAPTTTPCNKCEACISIGRGDDIDVIEIDGASNNSVEEVRKLRENAIFRPARCRFKIYYIDEVHMLSTAAFNALLKTLEEPPEHVKFIFSTTETEKIPATIISRCQRFDFRNIPTARIAEHLATICKAEKVPAEPDALYRVARAASGSMRDSLSLLDQLLAGASKITDEEVIRVLGTPSDERTIAILRAVADGDAATALGELAAVLTAGVTLNSAAAAMGDLYRNMMLAAVCGPGSELIELPETQRKEVAELAGRFSMPVLVQAVSIIQNVARNIRGSSVGRSLLEAALVRLAEAEKFVDPASLVERLEQLSGGVASPTAATGQKKKSAPVTKPPSTMPAASAPPAPTAPPKESPAPLRQLSTKERDDVQQDPAVREVITLFDGELVDITKDRPDQQDEVNNENEQSE